MRFIRREDKSKTKQKLLFSRLQQIIPPHRKNDIPVVTESGAERQDEREPSFEDRMKEALGAARAFHRSYSFD